MYVFVSVRCVGGEEVVFLWFLVFRIGLGCTLFGVDGVLFGINLFLFTRLGRFRVDFGYRFSCGVVLI